MNTPDWPGILEVRADSVVFRVFSPRQQTIRATSVAISSIVPLVFFGISLIRLFSYAAQSIPVDLWWGWKLALGILLFLAGLLILVLSIYGSIYLVDFLTFHLQARFSKEDGILKLKDVQMGRFRQIIRASIQKELDPESHEQTEVVITVAATRRAMSNALRPWLAVTGNPVKDSLGNLIKIISTRSTCPDQMRPASQHRL